MQSQNFIPLNIAIIGAGLGGLSAALALRRAGHVVNIYERNDFTGEIGAGISVASNGSQWLERWGLNIDAAKPVSLRHMTIHEWETGNVIAEMGIGQYKEKFGSDYYAFQRIDMHKALLDTVMQEEGTGTPCSLTTSHVAIDASPEEGTVFFANGDSVSADLVIAADGIRSRIRSAIGITPEVEGSTSCCYRCIIAADKLRELGLEDFVSSETIQFWGGFGINKVVMGACHGGELVSCYCFYPTAYNSLSKDGWNISATPQQLVDTFATVDPRVKTLFLHATDIKMWRLYVHSPYPYWVRGRIALLGDAAHPMLPDQSQGFCQALEDAAALGLVFSKQYFQGSEQGIRDALRRYEQVRMGRATRIQEASAKARTDLKERIGWSTGNERPGKLTVEDVCGYDMEAHLRQVVAAEKGAS